MTSAPELQQKLFKRMGLDVPEPKPQRNGTRRAGQQLSRKEQRKAQRERLAQDDAEIEAFERKLGIKKGRKSLPQSFREDGLGDLLGNLSGKEDVSDNDDDNKKRKNANILSIVKSVEELYQNNARGDVTDVITDAIVAQISKPESLPDQFFVLTGGFAAAIYRLIGSSFGSVLIRRIVEDFGGHYEQASKGQNAESAIQKEASNILTLLSQLYVFEVVTCKIIFDYMERLLSDLNEINVELLLRICRMAGRMLKQDDQQSLKHVSGVLNQSVSKVGYTNISARTKFMVETITDLTKGKKKARGLDFTVVSEHVQRMKKRLGELKSQSRRLDGLAPMGVGLVDIEGAETRGKWWLVGASVPTTLLDKSKKGHVSDAEMSDHEDMDIVLPDYPKKARAQGLSGTAQIAIFTALMTASNFEHAYRQFVNLRLKKDDQLALATVLVQCVGSEMQYNPYYALVGGKACLSNSRIRFAIQDRLWKIFRSLGESMFGEAPEEDESADAERMKDERRIANVAKFYAALVADGTLNIAILKPLELPEANHWTSMFVQLFILALLKECRSKKKSTEEDMKLKKIFGVARDLPGLAAGIHWMIRKKVRRTKLVSAKESQKLEGVCEKAQIIVRPAAIEV
ncbi:hypothetical protein FPRO04_03045 [Fusarium proliferatum]|nr:hypothetical protein FPRO03_05341 [Fusarium proliferatum]KAG4269385.1 hypothetical protein FPRO04_03045 [Fusarium proliferatum]